MSIESDGDRLDIIRTLAGIAVDEITVRHPMGSFAAIFDNEYYEAQLGPGIETAQPVLTARTIDVHLLVKDTPVELMQDDGTVQQYRIMRHEADGTGLSRVYLRR